jgi:hypothetical protein
MPFLNTHTQHGTRVLNATPYVINAPLITLHTLFLHLNATMQKAKVTGLTAITQHYITIAVITGFRPPYQSIAVCTIIANYLG